LSALTAIELAGRAALVLGGADGVGYAVADELAAAGAEVTIADAAGAGLERAAIRLAAHTLECDFAVPVAAAAAVAAARAEHGRLDLLVCAQARRPSTHLEASLAAIEAAAAAIEAGGEGGRIVVVTAPNAAGGGAGFEGEQGELRRRARAAAAELARRRIALNLVVPGWVRTADYEAAPAAAESELNPLGILGEPGDVASAVLWLLDPDNAFVSGAEIAVDGGQSATRG
jgi:3alpha(or 20beta)-hydroxysteroid dehydrogenase